ncbi:transmembrane emp24 domain-containing protein 9-like [Sparus aurata]|uniref:Transmembrane p24 trafficking protein 9 n=1 Tax=Sparus aurata TaxID=8175 RepID=A0A671UHI8_SPAAU|nr:transmembrane emp24 domain-containing protein 9-like [Sparus aurata]
MSVRMRSCLLSVLFLNVFCSFVSSLYFHIGDTEKKCFIQEIPDDTMIIVNFQTHLSHEHIGTDLQDNHNLWVLIEAKDPDDELVLSKQFASEGTFRFTSLKAGRHLICLQSSSSRCPLPAGGMLMVHLDIKAGECTNNYTKIAATDKLSELQLRVRQLTEQVRQIQREQDYHRLREKHFREVDHNTNMWVFWWPVIRSLFVVAVITASTNSW